MTTKTSITLLIIGIGIIFYPFTVFSQKGATHNNPELVQQASEWLYKQGNHGFLENKGQMTDIEGNPVPFVLFKAEAPGLNLWLTQTGFTLQTFKQANVRSEYNTNEILPEQTKQKNSVFKWERVDAELKNATIKAENIIKEHVRQGNKNYFFAHCPDGIYEVQEYEKITFRNVYPNIDWVWYIDKNKGYKYDFVVHPGGEYSQIELVYKSRLPVSINTNGESEIFTQYGNIREHKPVSYSKNQVLQTNFVLAYQHCTEVHGDKGYESHIRFDIPAFSAGQEVIIDPVLSWATFFGGNYHDNGISLASDKSGNVLMTGYTVSVNFPAVNPGGGAYFQGTGTGTEDGFIAKFSDSGVLLWATYYGGTSTEQMYDIVCDNSDNVYVTGITYSTNFPVFNPGTGAYFMGLNAGAYDAFIIKFSDNGTRLWATYYGGSYLDYAQAITCDNSGNVYIAGYTYSTNFPVLNYGSGAYWQSGTAGNTDGFIVKFNTNGLRLWSTYYGSAQYDNITTMICDNANNLFVAGYTSAHAVLPMNLPILDPGGGAYFQGTGTVSSTGYTEGFITKFSSGSGLLWGTYYGAGADDKVLSLACDNTGNIFMAGVTDSPGFPVFNPGGGAYFIGSKRGNFDAFIVKFSNSGVRLWATYYGGANNELFSSYKNLAVDNCGTVFMTFETNSTNFHKLSPCDGGFFENTLPGIKNQFIVRFSNTGVLLWTTYIPGDGNSFRSPVTVNSMGNLFVSGVYASISDSTTYTTVNPGGGTYYDGSPNGLEEAFMLRFNCSDLTACGITCNTCNILSANNTNTIGYENIFLYPNPATEEVFLNIPEYNGRTIEGEILTIYGQVIQKLIVSQEVTRLNVSELPKGLYFIRVEGYKVQKLVKQ